MAATHETNYKAEPEEDEINAIIEGENEFNASKYTDWKALKASN
jgi:hypothetical protein